MVDAVTTEQLETWLALEWMDGEPWEHTATLCAAFHNAVLIVAATNMATDEGVNSLKKLSRTADYFMPAHVRLPKRRTRVKKQDTTSADSWMQEMAGLNG